MRSVRRVGEAGTHPTSTDHVSGPIQTASNGETVGKNQVNSLYMALTPYGGWHGEKNSAESWTRRTTHTGDEVGYYEFDQRFEHPGRTWASATHRAFTFACVGAAMANETWKFVQAKSKQAMKQVLGIRDEKTRMKVTLPLALAPVTQEDDMRWNPNDDGIVSNP